MAKGWPRPGSKGIDRPSASDTTPRPMPTNNWPGHQTMSRNMEERPMRSPKDAFSPQNIDPGKPAGKG
jgi:hypothetical protein